MALRDQPYFPLYIQDFLTDEKLIECSASSTGIYIRCLCLMHKQDEYGKILLKQKDKQTDKQVENFAYKLARQMPYTYETILEGLNELLSENVLNIEGDYLVQRRMVRDNELSLKRSESGSKGGKFAQANNKAKIQANSEYEIENEIVIDSSTDIVDNRKKGVRKKNKFVPPTLDEVVKYFVENGYTAEHAKKAFNYYNDSDWKDSRNNQVLNWKQKMQNNWMKDEGKAKSDHNLTDEWEYVRWSEEFRVHIYRNKLTGRFKQIIPPETRI